MKLNILSTNVSLKKGTIKLPQPFITLCSYGVNGDAHAGTWHRQVSLLGIESIQKFSKEARRNIAFGEFAENITTEGICLYEMHPFDRLRGENIELEVTQIGKKCHGSNCTIFQEVGNCVMPKEGIFARVIAGGELRAGQQLQFVPKVYKAMIITLSDRASKGEYEDKSGPLLARLVREHFDKEKKKTDIVTYLIADSAAALTALLIDAKENNYDLILTTGGTGIGPRDISPDIVRRHLDKEIPGIMEHVRTKYGADKPNVLLSRGVAGTMGKGLVFTLPGNPKAIDEYCTEIFKVLDHAFLMLHGIDGH
ncbi:MAG: molybdenum cofactor synthesis domain-containing protein [Methylococcaceae bacterium]